MIKIVTDSTSDIPKTIAEEFDIYVVPCFVNFGSTSFLDGVDITRSEFYARLPGSTPLPTTSAPNIDMFVNAYRKLAREGIKQIFSVHVAGTLSSTVNVARIAAREVKDIVEVVIHDSGQLSLGVGRQVISAALAAIQNCDLPEIRSLLKDKAESTYTFASLETLEYLKRSGRLNQIQFRLGTLLDIKPVIRLHQGILDFDMVRTRTKSIANMIKKVNALGHLETIDIVHTNAFKKVNQVKEMAKSIIPETNTQMIETATSAIGTHIGPNAVGVVCTIGA